MNPGATGKDDDHKERNPIMDPGGFLAAWHHRAKLLEVQSPLWFLKSRSQMQSHALHWKQCRFTRVNRGAQGWVKCGLPFLTKIGKRTRRPFAVAETWWNPNCQAQTKISTRKITFQVQREGVCRNCHTQPDPTLLGRLCFDFRAVPLHPIDILCQMRSLRKIFIYMGLSWVFFFIVFVLFAFFVCFYVFCCCCSPYGKLFGVFSGECGEDLFWGLVLSSVTGAIRGQDTKTAVSILQNHGNDLISDDLWHFFASSDCIPPR